MLGAAGKQACFLERMVGFFAGGGESVSAYVSSGNWYLGGSSQQNSIGDTARCLVWP